MGSRWTKRVAWSAVGVLALSTAALAQTSGDPAGAPSPSTPPAPSVWNRVVGAWSWTEHAAVDAAHWMHENIAPERAEALWNELGDAAREKYARALDEARLHYEATLGVRLLDAAPSGLTSSGVAPVPTWTRLDQSSTTLPAHLVLLVHGLDEPGDVWDDLAPTLASAGLPVARFDYPNDGPIHADAESLAAALAQLRGRGVTDIDFVCHSMGGLVARDVLTRADEKMYAGDAAGSALLPAVGRLVMIGTPNAGSAWAHLEVLAEARDQFERWLHSDTTDLSSLLGFMVDGHGEAADDLLPGSAFLRDLNGRPAPKGVRITLVAGRMIPFTRESAMKLLGSRFVQLVLSQSRIATLASEVDDISSALGDGPVGIASARLAGVDDYVECSTEHCFLLRPSPLSSDPPPALAIVLERLGVQK